MYDAAYPLRKVRGFEFVDEGSSTTRPPVILLHGMLGGPGNWTDTVHTLSRASYRVIIPLLPVYDLSTSATGVPALVRFLRDFAAAVGLGRVILAGNSLGGQLALLYTLRHQEDVAALILSGSSGIYEVEMGASMPRRRDREYIRERAALTFYDPVHATDQLVEEMFGIVNDRGRVARLIKMARSTKVESLIGRLEEIHVPSLLVWGRDDLITPPEVAQTFHEGLSNSELHFIDRCGHAPMIERPAAFNAIILDFLKRTAEATSEPSVAHR